MNPGLATWEAAGVNVGTVEQQLTRLWSASESKWTGHGRRPDIRTSVLNLIVYADDEAALQRAEDEIDHLSGTHPSRSIIITPAGDGATGPLDARVSIKSFGAYADYGQVCAEQVLLRVHGDAAAHLDSVVIPLLAPDLPVFLWWLGGKPFQHPGFRQLSGTADRVILDSREFVNPTAGLVAMAGAMRATAAACAISDFNWLRIGPWRQAVCTFFDVASFRPYLDRLSLLAITCPSPGTTGPGLELAQALLLGGWLGAALDLQPASRQFEPNRYQVDLAHGDTRLHLDIRLCPPGGASGDTLFQLAAGHGDQAESERPQFAICAADAPLLTARLSTDGQAPLLQQASLTPIEETQLLFHQLETFGHDRLFERALAMAGSILESGQRDYRVRASLLA
ncbi:MAG: glucose-6-phosphate dehydrogenase assembly protein OpcA [Chloroflexota bacterium]